MLARNVWSVGVTLCAKVSNPLPTSNHLILGSEKVIRLLVGNKRNYPLALVRSSSREKGKMFTEFSVMMRCIREGYLASIMNLHYLDSASMVMTVQVCN
jgi:DNA-directed RNA polymerase I subunit RPA2